MEDFARAIVDEALRVKLKAENESLKYLESIARAIVDETLGVQPKAQINSWTGWMINAISGRSVSDSVGGAVRVHLLTNSVQHQDSLLVRKFGLGKKSSTEV